MSISFDNLQQTSDEHCQKSQLMTENRTCLRRTGLTCIFNSGLWQSEAWRLHTAIGGRSFKELKELSISLCLFFPG